jgi:hypothetical protein
MPRSTMNELMRVAGTFQQVSGKTVVIEPQDTENKTVALRIDMGNGVKLGLGYYTKLEAVKVLKALTMYVDALKPKIPTAYMIPGAAVPTNLFVPPGK